MSRRTLITAVLLPMLLGLLALFQLIVGGNALPLWIASISIRQEHDPLVYLRVLVAVELTLALVLVGLGRNGSPLAWIMLIAVGFTALAECSAALANEITTSFVTSGFLLACVVVLAVLLGRAPKPETNPDEVRKAGVLRWVALVFVILIGTSIALNIPVAPRTVAEGRPVVSTNTRPEGEGPVFDFKTNEWEGRNINEIELATFVPEVVGHTEKGRSMVVLYNLGCGDCHDFFDVHFSEGYHLPVMAIEVPPAATAIMSESARTDPVNCPDCNFTSLPPGPLWLVTPPLVLLVEDGEILCVESVEPTRCLDDA